MCMKILKLLLCLVFVSSGAQVCAWPKLRECLSGLVKNKKTTEKKAPAPRVAQRSTAKAASSASELKPTFDPGKHVLEARLKAIEQEPQIWGDRALSADLAPQQVAHASIDDVLDEVKSHDDYVVGIQEHAA